VGRLCVVQCSLDGVVEQDIRHGVRYETGTLSSECFGVG